MCGASDPAQRSLYIFHEEPAAFESAAKQVSLFVESARASEKNENNNIKNITGDNKHHTSSSRTQPLLTLPAPHNPRTHQPFPSSTTSLVLYLLKRESRREALCSKRTRQPVAPHTFRRTNRRTDLMSCLEFNIKNRRRFSARFSDFSRFNNNPGLPPQACIYILVYLTSPLPLPTNTSSRSLVHFLPCPLPHVSVDNKTSTEKLFPHHRASGTALSIFHARGIHDQPTYRHIRGE